MEIKIERKRKKNASIRIDNSGLVIVSVPLYFTDKMIDDFIIKYDSWIKKNLNKALDETININLSEGSTIYILSNPYIVRLIIDKMNFVELDDGFINIHTKELSDSLITKTFNKFIKDLTIKAYQEALDKYLKLTGLYINELKIKKMKRAYGKCYYERKIIILNTTLIHKSMSFIEAIVMHEIAHLKYPNHQAEFYKYIYKYMPDYKERMKNK